MTNLDWRIELFGNLRAMTESGKTVITRFRTKRGSLLLAYLALQPGRSHSRDEIGEMLWPEEDPSLQRSRLRYELSTLRALLGADVFDAEGGSTTIALRSTVTSDVADFDNVLRAAMRARTAEQRLSPLRKAVFLNRDDLLPGFFLPEGCPPENDWISLERERLRQRRFDAMVQLADALETLGIYNEAASIREEMRRHFPDRDIPSGAAPTSVPPALIPPAPAPGPQGRFFGRAKELEAIRQWAVEQETTSPRMPSQRLLTLTGTGGVGKTRLALEALLGHLPGVFVPLAGIIDASRLFETIHRALRLPERPMLPPPAQVLEALRTQGRFLLVLDNFEQIARQGAPLVADLLARCPELRCLVTSRCPLQIEEEMIWALSPLPGEDASALFLERARTVRPDFAVTAAGVQAAREAVRLLEGIPLALELAAARAIVLTPVQLRDQLADRLRFLVRIRTDAERRHASLRATLEWSVSLLSDSARHTFARLSVFRSAATLAAVAAVCGEGPAPALDAVEELCLQSLITPTFADDESEARYDMLTVVREFAAELLTPEEQRQAQALHARYWCEEAPRIQSAFRAGALADARRRLLYDIENVRAATESCFASGDAERIYRVLDSLSTPLIELGFWDEVVRLLDYLEPVAAPDPIRTGRLLSLRGALARRRGDEETARIAWERQLEIARASGDPDAITGILFDLAGQAVDIADYLRAQFLLKEGMERAVPAALSHRIVVGHVLRARLQFAQENIAEATVAADTALALLRERPQNKTITFYILIHIIPLYRRTGATETIIPLLQEGFDIAYEGEQRFLMARLLDELAPFCESQAILPLAYLAYLVAQKIHGELASRLSMKSAQALDEFEARHPEIKESQKGSADVPWHVLIEQVHHTLPEVFRNRSKATETS